MSDKNTAKSDNNPKSRFTLIELLSILLLVGLIFVFVVPVNQAKISRERVNEAVNTLRILGEKAQAFKDNPDNGYYPDLSQLNLGDQFKSRYFTYAINPDDSTAVAITTLEFGSPDSLYIVYNLNGKQYRVGKNDNDIESLKRINENWIP